MLKDYHDNVILLQSLRERDLTAFDFLYTTFRKRLFLLAFYILKDEEIAKDIVHEFFLDLWDNKLYEKISSSVKSYITQAVKNRSINYKTQANTRLNQVAKELAGHLPTTNYPLENEELKAFVELQINKLPPMARKVFWMHYVDQQSYAEIAEKLKISKSTINNHINRALQELRENLKNL